jgi:hypothetical protein
MATSFSRLSLCNRSSFCAENVLVTIVPSFHYDAPLPLLSSTHRGVAGPFVAGMPTEVPLWIAKTLHQRNLAQIHLPDWLSTKSLAETLHDERETTLLTSTLPFYYFEIARALNFCTPRPAQVVLQDLTSLRCDKLRQHFHELSRNELSQPRAGGKSLDDEDGEDDNDLPMISVQGIASYEINRVGPFLQRAFSDYGFLTKRSLDGDAGPGIGQRGKENNASMSQDEGGRSSVKESQSQDSTRKASMARSRLRRFRS